MAGVKFQVLGYRDFNRKADEKHMTIVSCGTQCTPDDNSRGSFGMKIVEFFLPDELVGSITKDAIGKEFVPDYGLGSYGKPVLVSYELQPWK